MRARGRDRWGEGRGPTKGTLGEGRTGKGRAGREPRETKARRPEGEGRDEGGMLEKKGWRPNVGNGGVKRWGKGLRVVRKGARETVWRDSWGLGCCKMGRRDRGGGPGQGREQIR